jgi:hypothetical protein
MTIGDWFTLIAVVVALFFGVYSIVQSNMMQKKQQRHALLKELIDWCTQIIEAIRLEEIPVVGNQDLLIARRRVFGNKVFKLLALKGNMEYMYHIAAINHNLQTKVEMLQNKLNDVVDLTFGKVEKGKIEQENVEDTTFKELQGIASDIIITAAKIRTENVL